MTAGTADLDVRGAQGASWGRRAAIRATVWAARAYGWAGQQKIGASLPGLGCIALVSAGLAMKLGVWAGLVAAGVGLGMIDRRL